jgi:hypothetical protein
LGFAQLGQSLEVDAVKRAWVAALSVVATVLVVVAVIALSRGFADHNGAKTQVVAEVEPSTPSSSGPPATQTDVTVNLPDSEILVPDSSNGSPQLSSSAAWSLYQAQMGSTSSSIPSSVSEIVLGDLSIPVDPQDLAEDQTFTVHDQFAYGYKLPNSCAPITFPSSSDENQSSEPTPQLCTEWVFLNANTGSALDDTYAP